MTSGSGCCPMFPSCARCLAPICAVSSSNNSSRAVLSSCPGWTRRQHSSRGLLAGLTSAARGEAASRPQPPGWPAAAGRIGQAFRPTHPAPAQASGQSGRSPEPQGSSAGPQFGSVHRPGDAKHSLQRRAPIPTLCGGALRCRHAASPKGSWNREAAEAGQLAAASGAERQAEGPHDWQQDNCTNIGDCTSVTPTSTLVESACSGERLVDQVGLLAK